MSILSVHTGYNFSDILTEVGAALIAVAKERGNYSKVFESVKRLIKSGGVEHDRCRRFDNSL